MPKGKMEKLTQENKGSSPQPMFDVVIGLVSCQRSQRGDLRWSKHSALVHENQGTCEPYSLVSAWTYRPAQLPHSLLILTNNKAGDRMWCVQEASIWIYLVERGMYTMRAAQFPRHSASGARALLAFTNKCSPVLEKGF